MPAIEVIEFDDETDRMYQEIASVVRGWHKRNIQPDVSIARLLMVALTMGEHLGVSPTNFHTFVDNFYGVGNAATPKVKA